MSEQFNDLKMERLRLSGYTDGSIDDRWHEYLKTSTGWESGDPSHVNDLEGLWLEQHGAIGATLPDLWMDYLTTAGFNLSDALPDMLYDFWSSTEVLP